jgi:hypothetical protein
LDLILAQMGGANVVNFHVGIDVPGIEINSTNFSKVISIMDYGVVDMVTRDRLLSNCKLP